VIATIKDNEILYEMLLAARTRLLPDQSDRKKSPDFWDEIHAEE